MPYIPLSLRVELLPAIEQLSAAMQRLPEWEDKQDGITNYAITELVLRKIGRPSYAKINAAIGVLNCVEHELYRRVGAPYENTAITKNGDIPGMNSETE